MLTEVRKEITGEREESVVFSVEGRRVTLNFLPEPCEGALESVKSLLVRSLYDGSGMKKNT